jgi:glucose/arabinose dehydrogenase
MNQRRAIFLLVLAGALLVLYIFLRGRQYGRDITGIPAPTVQIPRATSQSVLTGRDAFGDTTADRPGLRRLITVEDLPAPDESSSVANPPEEIRRPANAWPQGPAGFEVRLYARGLDGPRKIVTAPNGDIFVAESEAGRIRVLRGTRADGSRDQMETFAAGLSRPFGIAFYPNGANPAYVYVANTGSVVRFPYQNGDLKARAAPETVVSNLPSGWMGGGHWTRDIVFSRDGSKMYVSVGSFSNVSATYLENRRADILEFTPDGKNERIYASGIRNPSGLAIHPETGDLWASVNERDGLGDNLVPDYITRVTRGGFYGWPWYYIGSHQDPRHKGERPDLRDHVLTPDVLLQAHSASLCLTFYDATQFPAEYRGDGFAAEHGSWNRSRRTGYKVIRIPTRNGVPTGEYEDFLTGFVTADGDVWGRPVGVTVAKDGSLLVSDDVSNSIWRVSYVAGSQPSRPPSN